MKRKLRIVAIALILLCFTLAVVLRVKSVDTRIQEVPIEDLINGVIDNSKVQFSSNPYHYVKDNPYYEAIVSYGNEIVPILERAMDDSGKSGLKEYILAIAIEEITKVDLKGDNFGWATGKAFSVTWKYHLKLMPSRIAEIMESNIDSEMKKERLIELGTMSIPLILEYIENNETDVDIKGVLSLLLSDKEKKELKFNQRIEIKEWVKVNQQYFNKMQKYVKSKKSYSQQFSD